MPMKYYWLWPTLHDLMGLDEINRALKKRIRQAVVKESDLLNAIDQAYRRTDEINSLADQLSEELAENAFDLNRLNRKQRNQ